MCVSLDVLNVEIPVNVCVSVCISVNLRTIVFVCVCTCVQAVYNIITGTYPCSEEEAIQLAALQFQAKFGKHNPSSYGPSPLTHTHTHTHTRTLT